MFLQAVDTGPVSNPKPETDCTGKGINYQLGFLDHDTLFKQGQECLMQYFQPTHIFETPYFTSENYCQDPLCLISKLLVFIGNEDRGSAYSCP